MPDGIKVRCRVCEEPHVVAFPTLGRFKDPTGEVPLAVLPETRDKAPVVPERLVEADERGHFKCRACGEVNQVPSMDLMEGKSPAA